MTSLEEEIVKLTQIWQYFVGQDHHKDRDVHWYITQYYSYGDKPYFQARHYGYIANDFEGTKCTTLEEAQEELRDTLIVEIHKAKIWVNRNLEQALKESKEDTESWYNPDEYQRMLWALNGEFEKLGYQK